MFDFKFNRFWHACHQQVDNTYILRIYSLYIRFIYSQVVHKKYIKSIWVYDTYIYTFYILMHSIWNVYEKYYVYNKYTKRIPYVSYTFRILYMSIQNVYKTYISIGKVWHTFHILFIYSCEYIKRIAYLFVTYYIRFVYVLYTRLFDISSGGVAFSGAPPPHPALPHDSVGLLASTLSQL